MFTGLVEEIGVIKNVSSKGSSKVFEVTSKVVIKNMNIGDSICVNGACQTVVYFDNASFRFESVLETLKKTNLANLKIGDKVNLESSLTLSKKIGGHLVLGHVDCIGTVLSIQNLNSSWLVEISYPKEFNKYIVNVGSVAVNGVSLTVASSKSSSFVVSIIPHTFENTNLCDLKIGSKINIEFDIIGKYIEKLLLANNKANQIDWKSLLSS